MINQTTGLLRVIDAVHVVDRVPTAAEARRSIDFPEADFASVTASDLVSVALEALHPDKKQQQQNSGSDGEWVVPPTVVAANNGDDAFEGGGFALPAQASLLTSSLRPAAGAASEVFLTGQWRWFVPGGHQRDVVVATVDASSSNNYDDGNMSTAASLGNNNNNNDDDVSLGFAPSLVQVTLWSVRDKKIVSKFSGIAVSDMDIDVADVAVRDDSAKLFPFAFDPSVVPAVRVRSKNDLVHDGQQSRHTMAVLQHQQQRSSSGGGGGGMHYFSSNSDQSASFALAASAMSPSSQAARVEAEYGAAKTTRSSNNNNNTSTNYSPRPGSQKLQQVPPSESRDWKQWFEQRRNARDQHVKSVLVPSSQEQIEVERALQVKTIEDVRRVSRNASLELASSAQLLQQKLELVREGILRERIGDAAFARVEGARGVLTPGLSKTSVAAGGGGDEESRAGGGSDRDPLVVNLW